MKDCKGKYEFHAHTADAKFTAHGRTREELFANAGEACFAIITDPPAVKPNLDFPLSVSGKNLDSLLFDFLDALLFLLDTEGFLLHEARDLKITERDGLLHLECVAFGDYHKDYDVSCNVKAVTYNQMHVREDGDGWHATVVVDL